MNGPAPASRICATCRHWGQDLNWRPNPSGHWQGLCRHLDLATLAGACCQDWAPTFSTAATTDMPVSIDLAAQAQRMANITGARCWVVHLRSGASYVTHRADLIAPGYTGLEVYDPRPENRSCWPPSSGCVA